MGGPLAWSHPMGPVGSSGQHSIHLPSLYPMDSENLAHFLPFWLQPPALPPGFPVFQTIAKAPYQCLLSFLLPKTKSFKPLFCCY